MKKQGARKWLWGITWMLCLAAIWRISHFMTMQDPERKDPSFLYTLFGNTAERDIIPALDMPTNWNVRQAVQEAAASMILPVLSFMGHMNADSYATGPDASDEPKQGEVAAKVSARISGESLVEESQEEGTGALEGNLEETAESVKGSQEEPEAGALEGNLEETAESVKGSQEESEAGTLEGNLGETAGFLEESQDAPEAELSEAASLLRISMVREIPLESLSDYGELVKSFYQIDPTTMADKSLLNAERFMAKDLRIDREVDGPQILIFHTHSQEAYADSVSGDPKTTVVGVGEELTRILEETYGYQVLHHEEVYDKPSRNGAYSRALPKIKALLSEHPGIQVVIDLHRDEMPEKTRLVTEVNGKKTAKFMFFNGISRLKETGPLDYLRNDNLEENLAFSFQMEKAAQEYYPGLTRKIYLKGYRYNMHLAPKMLLVELGAQNNTLEEAMNACEPLAALLDLVLSGEP